MSTFALRQKPGPRKAVLTLGIRPPAEDPARVLAGLLAVPAASLPPPSDNRSPTDWALLKRWDASLDIAAPDAKKLEAVTKDGVVIDYRNVQLRGYLSTFKETTEADRQGDYVDPGAFTDTLKRFAANPVLLQDHRNQVDSLAGVFTEFKEDRRGLYVEAMLSNAPGLLNTRFKVAEGFLRTLSMGGLFHYKEDGRGIFKVDLWEGSLIPIPANPDARFQVRALNDVEKHYVKSMHLWTSWAQYCATLGEHK